MNQRQVEVYKLIFLRIRKTWAIFEIANTLFFLAKKSFFICKKINIIRTAYSVY